MHCQQKYNVYVPLATSFDITRTARDAHQKLHFKGTTINKKPFLSTVLQLAVCNVLHFLLRQPRPLSVCCKPIIIDKYSLIDNLFDHKNIADIQLHQFVHLNRLSRIKNQTLVLGVLLNNLTLLESMICLDEKFIISSLQTFVVYQTLKIRCVFLVVELTLSVGLIWLDEKNYKLFRDVCFLVNTQNSLRFF